MSATFAGQYGWPGGPAGQINWLKAMQQSAATPPVGGTSAGPATGTTDPAMPVSPDDAWARYLSYPAEGTGGMMQPYAGQWGDQSGLMFNTVGQPAGDATPASDWDAFGANQPGYREWLAAKNAASGTAVTEPGPGSEPYSPTGGADTGHRAGVPQTTGPVEPGSSQAQPGPSLPRRTEDWGRVYGARQGGTTGQLFQDVDEQNAYNMEGAGRERGYAQVTNALADPGSTYAAWLDKQFDWVRSRFDQFAQGPNKNATWTDFLTGRPGEDIAGQQTPATSANMRQLLADRYLQLPGWMQGRGDSPGGGFAGAMLGGYGGG